MVLSDTRSSYTPVLGRIIDDVENAFAECQDVVLYAHRFLPPLIVQCGNNRPCYLIAATPGRRSEPVIEFTKSRKTPRHLFFN